MQYYYILYANKNYYENTYLVDILKTRKRTVTQPEQQKHIIFVCIIVERLQEHIKST